MVSPYSSLGSSLSWKATFSRRALMRWNRNSWTLSCPEGLVRPYPIAALCLVQVHLRSHAPRGGVSWLVSLGQLTVLFCVRDQPLQEGRLQVLVRVCLTFPQRVIHSPRAALKKCWQPLQLLRIVPLIRCRAYSNLLNHTLASRSWSGSGRARPMPTLLAICVSWVSAPM